MLDFEIAPSYRGQGSGIVRSIFPITNKNSEGQENAKYFVLVPVIFIVLCFFMLVFTFSWHDPLMLCVG